jgi:hypothetical protein
MTPTTRGSAAATDHLEAAEELDELDQREDTSEPFAHTGGPIVRTVGAAPGSPCPRCGTPLDVDRGVLYDTVGRTTDPIVVLRCRINGHTFRETPLPTPRP